MLAQGSSDDISDTESWRSTLGSFFCALFCYLFCSYKLLSGYGCGNLIPFITAQEVLWCYFDVSIHYELTSLSSPNLYIGNQNNSTWEQNGKRGWGVVPVFVKWELCFPAYLLHWPFYTLCIFVAPAFFFFLNPRSVLVIWDRCRGRRIYLIFERNYWRNIAVFS